MHSQFIHTHTRAHTHMHTYTLTCTHMHTHTHTCMHTYDTHTHTHMNTHTLQKQQLVRLGVPSLFIAVALDEGPGPPLRSPYTDLSKLYSVVGILVRCCDITLMQKSLQVGREGVRRSCIDNMEVCCCFHFTVSSTKLDLHTLMLLVIVCTKFSDFSDQPLLLKLGVHECSKPCAKQSLATTNMQ